MLRLPLHQTAVDGGNIMSKFIPDNQKHLTLEDRIFIQNELNKGTTFKDIAIQTFSCIHYESEDKMSGKTCV